MTYRYYDQDSDLAGVFVGRRIIAAELNVEPPPDLDWDGRGSAPYGLVTLDNGTRVYVVGNDGGCACSAGCYSLTHLAAVDNIITSVEVHDGRGAEGYEDGGIWSIFVIAGADRINIAGFEGDDGYGYYGTGFHLTVIPAALAAEGEDQ